MERVVIARALVDALVLRQETHKHDISTEHAELLIAAAMPAFVSWEAAHYDSSADQTGRNGA